MLANDTLANVLYVDLCNKHYWVCQRADLFDKYLGGAGVAIHILDEECPTDADPLSGENPVVFAVGPLTGLFPLASKTVAMFKSPHTGNLGESHCGGRSAAAIRMAGYGAIVIKGKSDIPVYLAIHGDKVYFRDASSIWGIENSFTVGRIIRESETGAGLRTIMRIGGAGERLVSYACVTSETYRHFGRLGLGAVFGSKKLKAIVVSGRHSLPVSEFKVYRRTYEEIYDAAVSSPVMKKYHDLGTAENILPLNHLGALPTRNLAEAKFDGASGISGETFAEQHLGRRLACSHCPIACIHIAALREDYVDEPYFYKTHMISYDYEPIYSLGSMLGISDTRGFLSLMEQMEIFGLDAMSAGVVLAWATEAQERGIVSEKETRGLKFRWGDSSTFAKAVKLIVRQPNDFYGALARGVTYASSVYGGTEFALSLAGNEIPGYHTGPAAHVGVIVGARHSHLDNAGYSVDQKNLSKQQMNPEELATALLSEERWRQVLSSLVVCFFARGLYQPDIVLKALQLTGFPVTQKSLKSIGERIHRQKYRFKTRHGFTLDEVYLPKRILETGTPSGLLEEPYMKSVVDQYKRLVDDERGS
jgi:aldehyde:ferredoxin oxidoreductase